MFSDEELPPEEVDKYLESIARKVVDRELEIYAKVLLGMSWPLAFVGGQLGRVFISPYLFIFGDREDTVSKRIFVFEKKENIFKLIHKIDEFIEEREKIKEEKRIQGRDKDSKNKVKKTGLWNRFKEFMRF
jgi:hypothetical protein